MAYKIPITCTKNLHQSPTKRITSNGYILSDSHKPTINATCDGFQLLPRTYLVKFQVVVVVTIFVTIVVVVLNVVVVVVVEMFPFDIRHDIKPPHRLTQLSHQQSTNVIIDPIHRTSNIAV